MEVSRPLSPGEDLLRQQLLQQPLAGSDKASATDSRYSVQAVQAVQESQTDGETKLTEDEKQAFKEATQEMDTLLKPLSIGLSVQRIESLNRLYVQLFDRETGETLREVPPRKIIEMQENIRAFRGLLFDKFS
jgi:flagellar protein FlaG